MFRSLCKAKKYPTIMTGEEEAEEEWKNVRKELSEETEVKSGRGHTWEEELKKNGRMGKKIQRTRKEKSEEEIGE